MYPTSTFRAIVLTFRNVMKDWIEGGGDRCRCLSFGKFLKIKEVLFTKKKKKKREIGCETCIAFQWTSSVLDSSVWVQQSVFSSSSYSIFSHTTLAVSLELFLELVELLDLLKVPHVKKLHLSLISYKSSCKYQTTSYKVLLELFFITQPATQPFRMVVSFFCQAQPSPSPSWAE